MKAIAVPYVIDQNEPSIPVNQIIDLPSNDDHLRDEMLCEMFTEHVCEVDDEMLTVEETSEYGDLQVVCGDDMFLFITFIEQN